MIWHMTQHTITTQGVSYTLTGEGRGMFVLRPASNPNAAGTRTDETYGEFKLREDWYDEGDVTYSVLVIRQLLVAEGQRGKGHATEIIREVARLHPDALIQGENPSDDARRLHDRLNATFPSRMIDFEKGWGTGERVSPGAPLDPNELQPGALTRKLEKLDKERSGDVKPRGTVELARARRRGGGAV